MSTKTVLIVDDEVHIRHVLGMRISGAGYVLLTANNGQAAFDLAVEHRPDGIITDFQMPGGDGLDLCRRLADDDRTAGIPTMMLTVRGHRITPEQLKNTNIWKLLDKPFSPRKIIEQLAEMLDQASGDHDDLTIRTDRDAA